MNDKEISVWLTEDDRVAALVLQQGLENAGADCYSVLRNPGEGYEIWTKHPKGIADQVFEDSIESVRKSYHVDDNTEDEAEKPIYHS